MTKSYKSVRGTYDFNPQDTALFNNITQKARNIFSHFGYEEIILPILEEEAVFTRSVGETTDIVEKQIFRVSRREKEDSDIVLRPEGTAQVVRYYLENSLYKQSDFYKFSYIGPMFRGERPQKGRLRQFHHIGAEAIGSNSVFLDAEIIALCLAVLDTIGIKDKTLNINTLGCVKDKEQYMQALRRDLEDKKNHLCGDCKRRLEKNPLRILDCKQEPCKRIVKEFHLGEAGQKHLCEGCKEEFANLLDLLKAAGIKYNYNPILVRGLDYYTNTVFEITSQSLGSQDAIGAGGRYNNLIKSLGGPDIPAIGFAFGIERIMLAFGQKIETDTISVFVAAIGDAAKAEAYNILRDLRENGIPSDMDYCSKSLKAQMRYAQRRKANFVVMLGDDELKEGVAVIKNMNNSEQQKVKRNELLEVIRGYLANGEGIA